MTKHFHTLKHEVWLPYRFSVGPAFQRFYEELKEEKLLGNKCPRCERVLVPARTYCPACFVDMGEWVEVSQEGEIVSWMLANEAVFGLAVEPPFISALIRLDGVSCNFLHLLGGLNMNREDMIKKKIRAGARVKAVWNEQKRGHLLDIKYFEPT